jgi:pimeloyl-ACP methyl ester carboxylesterase
MSARAASTRPVFVLVHGAWHGAWCWRHVRARLSDKGYAVFTPTLTGLGERAHLLSPEVGIETFIADVAAVLEMEELADVVLVGHSFGANAISGVADRMPERIRRLIYLDGLVLQSGERPFDLIPPETVEARRKAAREEGGGIALPAPAPELFGVTRPADIAWLARRLTPHPVKSYEDRLTLRRELGAGLPKTYIRCTDPAFPSLRDTAERVRRMAGWDFREIATGHDAMVTAPEETVELLLDIVGATDMRSRRAG